MKNERGVFEIQSALVSGPEHFGEIPEKPEKLENSMVFNEKHIIFRLLSKKKHVFYELFEAPLRVRENLVFYVLCEPLLGFPGNHVFTCFSRLCLTFAATTYFILLFHQTRGRWRHCAGPSVELPQ